MRVFVAVAVPPDIQHALGQAIEQLRDGAPKKCVRWVRPENIHLTLRFIGNVQPQAIEPLTAALQAAVVGLRSFILQLDGAGCFPKDRAPRVLWMGLGGELDPLTQLQSRVETSTAAWGVVEERAFHPHLTLGRVVARKREELHQIGESIRGLSVPQSSPWRAEAIQLMRSVLAPGGSQYTVLASFPLIG